MIGLETNRLIFRQWKLEDFQELRTFFSIPKNAQYVGGVKDPESSWRLMATYIGHYHLKGYSYLAVEEKESGRLIGTVGLWNSDPWPELELGYWLIPAFQRKGFASEAGLAVKKFAFAELKVPTLVSYIDPENEPSKKLAKRMGGALEDSIPLLDFGIHEVYRYKG